MFFFFIVQIFSEVYPLIISIPKGQRIETPSSLSIPGTLPDNLIIFVIDQFKYDQISTAQQLKKWGNSYKYCDENGRTTTFPKVDSNIYNFVDQMRDLYSQKMNIDSSNECLCKMDQYQGGLVIVHVTDEEPEIVPQILEKAPSGTAIAFVASTEELFKY